jgi:hypothetical protein
MNPMAYRGPGQTLVGYEPPPAWAPPTPEQESLREPWIDPTTAFAGGFGANIMRRGLMGALRGGTAAAVADYPLGLATAGVENINPRLAMPFNIMGGMASGASFERGLENAMAGKAHPVRTAQKAFGNAMGQVDVWHGSPHSFDRFSMDKIGTGEGAQAFGHGLYFTDTKYIAEHYAKNLGDIEIKNWSINGIPIYKNGRPIDYRSGDNNFSQAKALFQEHMMIYEADIRNAFEKSQKEGLEAIQRHTDDLIDVYGDDDSSWSKSVVKYFKAMRPKDTSRIKWDVKSHQNLYKATLHKGKDPSEYVYLDWDKPLSEQPPETIKKLKQAQIPGWTYDELIENEADGESLYNNLSYALGRDARTGRPGSPKDASLFLKDAGIDGIRYPSGSLSGGSGQGKNYVVFDENAITIEERKALGR